MSDTEDHLKGMSKKEIKIIRLLAKVYLDFIVREADKEKTPSNPSKMKIKEL